MSQFGPDQCCEQTQMVPTVWPLRQTELQSFPWNPERQESHSSPIQFPAQAQVLLRRHSPWKLHGVSAPPGHGAEQSAVVNPLLQVHVPSPRAPSSQVPWPEHTPLCSFVGQVI